MTNAAVEIVKSKRNDILTRWIKAQIEDSTLRQNLMSDEDMHGQSEELLESLIGALGSNKLTSIETPEFIGVVDLLKSISNLRAHTGFTPRETVIFVLTLKKSILAVLHEEGEVPLGDVAELSDLLDDLAIVTVEAFISGREQVIARQSDEINEISTPVIKVWEGVLALPIIGTIDSARTQIVMENLLLKITETGCSIAILDISGVPTVDSLVAQHLIKTVNATRLMGAECIISGIRPEIAQTIIHLGIDLSGIQTKSSMAGALQLAFSKLKLELVKTTSTAQDIY